MYQNRHAYRNLGVACALLRCRRCEKETTFSVYLETDAKRQKICSLGCNECGGGGRIDETSYEQLYELSFEFDRLQEGKTTREAFEKQVPERCRLLFEKMQAAGEPSGQTAAAQEAAQTAANPAKSWPKPGGDVDRPAEVALSKATSDTLGTGFALAAMAGISLFAAELAFELPAWMSGAALLASGLGAMGIAFVVGALLSFKRFPRSVTISGKGIEIKPRGKADLLHYELGDVSRVNYGQGAKFLTLWFGDGKTFVVRVKGARVKQLDRYFDSSR